ncbi:MAG TPA: PaaI family thioesterase [bacterium]
MNSKEKKRFMETVKFAVNTSPFYKHMCLELVEYGDGTSKVIMKSGDNLKNLYGTLHGGGIASLIDSACSLAIVTKMEIDEISVTVDLKTSYIAPARDGTLTGLGKIIHRGKNIAIAEATVTDKNGKIIAHGGTIHFIKRERN